ncbi:L-serine ammonia-lyase, iron-sulfur-dependent, subunit alpha [Microaerobacter geothermalis]|uniref:L-serine ammonia-lyase, iron-sulfur-dependent, subunit alpha n=1 Tax=Microaerobacter geothermalis TaxID=674972 RepID=UPI001F3A3956|nr:L-serine ammonia-lyase, iron-sulfur-dependent, subunit alpha [Microaerobacter geothermalis]MCF6095056.1 L-serine ammonia-lyase, iron-sulfur-dependent, subunit alpha [Microaerobacter geothermalis]
MFSTVKELIDICNTENKPIWQVMLEAEMEVSGRSEDQILEQMNRNLDIMEEAVNRGIHEDIKSHSGLTGGDAKKIRKYMEENRFLSGFTILDAVSKAVATNEVNSAMGTIVATPTAGSCGIVPGTLFAVAPKLNASRDQMVHFLFTAGAMGYIIANNAFISGATGGCQAEVGSATAMAASAIVEMAGGTPEQSADALSIAMKNLLGLVCDPIAGLVEVPCVKRNAMGAAIAMVAADMALAGIKSVIPADEVILAMYRIGCSMPNTLKETALGGLAATPTGRALETKIFGRPSE